MVQTITPWLFSKSQELERHLAEIEASLPSEPRTDDENAVTLLVRMPDGSRRGRRFLKSDKLQVNLVKVGQSWYLFYAPSLSNSMVICFVVSLRLHWHWQSCQTWLLQIGEYITYFKMSKVPCFSAKIFFPPRQSLNACAYLRVETKFGRGMIWVYLLFWFKSLVSINFQTLNFA